MFPVVGSTAAASTSSGPSATSLPSKYMAKLPAVVSPNVPVNSSRSSSRAETDQETPGGEELDRVDVVGVRGQADVGAVEVHGEGADGVHAERGRTELDDVGVVDRDSVQNRAVGVEGEQDRARVDPGEGIDA